MSSINIDDLPKLIKNNPRLANLSGSIYGMDRVVRKILLEALQRFDDPERYAIKTQLSDQCYDILLWHKDIQTIVGTTWPLADFIEMCCKGEDFLNTQVTSRTINMTKRFDNLNSLDHENINWI